MENHPDFFNLPEEEQNKRFAYATKIENERRLSLGLPIISRDEEHCTKVGMYIHTYANGDKHLVELDVETRKEVILKVL